ncbi:hypothetical protein HGRIS_011257 [Hohenbuehelia grisea]|uniref:T6SS Phospholipase effector Tle1-like catalytic domain-containing protein n=1 Tax=Hohenbuehelia grisea TaxID=104357 RepID=A0ABR3JW95_9AGAR
MPTTMSFFLLIIHSVPWSYVSMELETSTSHSFVCFHNTQSPLHYRFDADNSNIVQFFSMLKKGDRDTQMVYYQAGIGTYTSPSIATPIAARISKKLDEMVAWNLGAHVQDGYEFLMQNYKANDRICIFGFSRGAYTARALAGMLNRVGLLPACNHQQVPFAYSMYARDDKFKDEAAKFKKAFSVHVQVEFLGVWDTVSSVGLFPRSLPFAKSNSMVNTFRHAIALDERRAKFKANHWKGPACSDPNHDHELPFEGGEAPRSSLPQFNRLTSFQKEYAKDPDALTDASEVWFAGCHCDIGGGSVPSDTPNTLARIPLRWMIRECFKAKTGIMFETDKLRELGLNPNKLWPQVAETYRARPDVSIDKTYTQGIANEILQDLMMGSETTEFTEEEKQEFLDAQSPIYDQLDISWGWKVLEWIPFTQETDLDGPRSAQQVNEGQGRLITEDSCPNVKIKVHKSVKTRIIDAHVRGKDYDPKAFLRSGLNLESDTIEWID